MKKQKKYLLIGIAILSLCLSGCGTPMFELTAEEEALIVHSAAYYVAKHNIQQKDGVNNTVYTGAEEDTEQNTQNGDPSTNPEKNNIIAETIGHGTDLEISFLEAYAADNYTEGNVCFVEAKQGYDLYIVKLQVKNITEQDVLLDNATLNPSFRLVAENVNVRAEVTILSVDFSTYRGTIAAGEAKDLILLFEVKEAQVETILEPILQIITENGTKDVKL